MIILSIRLFFLAARGMNPEGLPQLSGACLYSNPPLLLSLRVFLTPPSFGHLPYILLCKTQGRRVRVTFRSLRCNTPHTGHGKGRRWYHYRYFSNPSVLTDPSPIFCDAKHPVRLRGTAGERLGVAYFSSFLDTRGMRIDVYNCRTAATVSNIIQSGSSLNMKYEEATKKRDENVSMW